MTKIGKKTFERWEKENEDELCEAFEFDVNEILKRMDNEATKRITGYWEWAKSYYETQKSDEEYDKKGADK